MKKIMNETKGLSIEILEIFAYVAFLFMITLLIMR